MRARRDRTGGAQAARREPFVVVAAQHLQASIDDQRFRLLDASAAILQRGDARVRRQREQRVELDPHAGARGNVIDDQRRRGGIGDLREERLQRRLRWPQIGRCRHEEGGRQAVLAGLCHASQHVLRRRAGGAHRDGQVGVAHHRGEHRAALVVGQQGRLAGRGAHDETGDAGGGQPLDEAGQCVVIDLAAAQRRDDRNPESGEIDVCAHAKVLHGDDLTKRSPKACETWRAPRAGRCPVPSLIRRRNRSPGQTSGGFSCLLAAMPTAVACVGTAR